MRLKTFAILQLLSASAINAAGIFGNLVFFGRGQRHLPKNWCELEDISVSGNAKVYFPYSSLDVEEEPSKDPDEEPTNNPEEETQSKRDNIGAIVDTAANYPLSIYLPANAEQGYSEARFEVLRSDKIFSGTSTTEVPEITFSEFKTLKSELKLTPPTVEELKSGGYTCESIGLDCNDLSEYDFKASTDWVNHVEIKILFEDPVGINEVIYEDEKESYRKELELNNEPTNEWQEIIVPINIVTETGTLFTSLMFRNYGKMPVYLEVGNTIFLKEKPTYIFKDGAIQNGFASWSWSNSGFSIDTNAKFGDETDNAWLFQSYRDGDISCSVHIDNPTSGPPEALSFKIRTLRYNEFKVYIENKQELNYTEVQINQDRNCQIPLNEKVDVLLDVRSIAHLDSKKYYNNDITLYWVQSIGKVNEDLALQELVQKNNTYANLTDISDEKLAEIQTNIAEIDKLLDKFYIYDIVLHHTYPKDLTQYQHLIKLFDDRSDECSVAMKSYEDWPEKNLWPDDVAIEEIKESQNIGGEIKDPNNNQGNNPTETATETSTPTTTPTEAPKETNGAMKNSFSALAIIISLLYILF